MTLIVGDWVSCQDFLFANRGARPTDAEQCVNSAERRICRIYEELMEIQLTSSLMLISAT